MKKMAGRKKRPEDQPKIVVTEKVENMPDAQADAGSGTEISGDPSEYIVLNGQEDEAEPAQQGRLADYEELSTYQYFDCGAIRDSMHLTNAVRMKADKLCQDNKVTLDEVESGYMNGRVETVGEAFGEGRDGKTVFPVHMVFNRNSVLFAECQCTECRRRYYSIYYRREYCAYLGALMKKLEEYLQDRNVGDATDARASLLMRAFAERRANTVMSDASGRTESVSLVPRLALKNKELAVSFKVGAKKLFVVKDLFEFYQNVQESKTASYGSSTSFSHDISHFEPQSRKWIDFIGRIVKEEKAFEQRLINTNNYNKKALSKNGELALFGWRLDELYGLCQGDTLDFEDKDSSQKAKGTLRMVERNPKISMTIRKTALDGRRTFHGITVDCKIPFFYYGVGTAYYMEGDAFCRLEEDFLKKIGRLADFCRNGELSFQVGRNNLAEFYYSVLPQLSGAVDIMEENAEEIASYLPPQARFVFYLDAEQNNMSCRAEARYGDHAFSLFDIGKGKTLEPFREATREQEILYHVSQWFPCWDDEKEEMHCGGKDELMYQVLDKGVETLLSLGEVRCTRRFSNLNVGRRVRMSVGISVSKNLLNLEVSTQDVPPEELLDILKSYRQKKTYHRLKNGNFLKLDQENSLQTLAEMMETLRMSPDELLHGKVELPLYRALYLDKLLEKNEEIYSNRDSHFREMVKSFKTVNDADFEEPASLKSTMRGYQKNGYRWLRTLEAYQLGGILADDMGLGKTLQVLAVLLSAKKEGKKGTSLVVSPSFLIYNWAEEIARYTPELSFYVIIGLQETRRKKLETYADYDVIITSYDALKRDIRCYEGKEFLYQILDEAQYIKNHTTAAARSVKAVKSGVRYALTGTPIENRLSELWSIFDYLIPGYLYGYDVFRNEFEAPIVKDGDQAAMERLQRMIAPFILRRMKGEVLKDLPEKLEESRYVRFDTKQQQLYDAQVVHMKQRIVMQDAQEFQKNKIQILAELVKLRQICCDPRLCFENYSGDSAKLEGCMELVRSAIEGEHKILLFSQFASMLELIAERMKADGISFYTITGATPKEKRLQLVKAFNEDDTKVFLISLKAGGVGLNLTGADVVIHYDPWWNLAVQNQATDRTHRIGQTKVVVVYKLITKGTVEEKIQELQESKRALSEQIIQGDMGQLGSMSKEDFISLLS